MNSIVKSIWPCLRALVFPFFFFIAHTNFVVLFMYFMGDLDNGFKGDVILGMGLAIFYISAVGIIPISLFALLLIWIINGLHLLKDITFLMWLGMVTGLLCFLLVLGSLKTFITFVELF